LFKENGETDWKHIGTGEKYVVLQKRKLEAPAESKSTANKKQKINPTSMKGTDLLKAINEQNPKQGVFSGKALMETIASTRTPQKTNHYKIHEGDQCCLHVDLGEMWTMNMNGTVGCGITMKAKYIIKMISSSGVGVSNESPEKEEEAELPPDDSDF
jgi:hypothetical protein